jgi:predicted lipoprotein with Yx(FWY)xxD motif
MREQARTHSRSSSRGSSRIRRRPQRWLCASAGAALLLVFLASTALAAHLALALGSSANATLGESVVVSPQGRTLYTLSPETARHLLCKSGECLKHWPPLTVSSSATKLKSAPGVHGRLGILRRSNGTLQVTLRGLPLYRYAEDHARGQAKGEGVEGFGGTWHAMTASSGESPHQPAMTGTPPMPPPTTPPPPSYPASTPSEPTTGTATTPSTPTTTPTTPTPPPYPYPVY